jgi:hypothetical protein
MKLVGNDVIYPKACEDFEVNPKAHGVAAGFSVRSGAGDVRLKNDDFVRLRALQRVHGVVKLNLGHFRFYAGVVAAAAGEKHDVFAPHGFPHGNFHFAVRETIRAKKFNPVDCFGE